MTKLCPRGKAAAKRKFKVYPSAYANAYASKICAGKIKDPSGVKRKDFRGSKAEGGLMEATARLKRQGLKEGDSVARKTPLKSKSNLSPQKRKEQIIRKRKLQRELTGVTGRQGLLRGGVARGCGRIMSDRKKVTKVF